MLYFPQLISGAMVQYPILKRRRKRTIVNQLADGRTVRMADPNWDEVIWEIRLRGLSSDEWESIHSFSEGVEGRLRTFTFLDPAHNLLGWSEELTASVWARDPGLELIGGIPDPLSDTSATRIVNAAQAAQRLWQPTEAPGWYVYSLSLYVRSAAGSPVTVFRTATDKTSSAVYVTGPDWRRITSSGALDGATGQLSCGIELSAGGSVDVFGFQLEAQWNPSPYKKTPAAGGVHRRARLVDDVSELKSDDPQQHGTVIRVSSRVEV